MFFICGSNYQYIGERALAGFLSSEASEDLIFIDKLPKKRIDF